MKYIVLFQTSGLFNCLLACYQLPCRCFFLITITKTGFFPMQSFKQLVLSLRLLLTITVTTAITACGGGGGGDANQSPVADTPSVPVLIKPDYQGKTTTTDILPQNAANLSFELTTALDFLNLLGFGDTVEYFLIHPNGDSDQSSDESVCQSGLVTTTEIRANQEIRVDYKNCVQEGILFNGSLTVYLVGFRDAELDDIDIVADLTVEDPISNELLVLSGYIKVREGLGNFETTATYQIMLQNELGEQMYFDDFTASISYDGNDRGIDYQGDVYFSELGKLTVSTQDLFDNQDNGQRMEISSNNSIVIDIYLQEQIIITFSENTIPQSISLIEPPIATFDDINEQPNALISADSFTTDRDVEITLSSRDSSDPDYDVLSFSWDIISAPQGAAWSITQTVDTVFSADLPGSYTLKLVVDDNQSAAVETTQVVTVEKGLPSGNINILTPDMVIDGVFSAQIQIDNDQYDRPFSYRLAYGPSGMQVDQQGAITWHAHIPDFGVTTDVNFAIEVLNSDKNSRLSSLVSVVSSPDHKITKLLTYDAFDRIDFDTQKQRYRDKNNRERFTAFVTQVPMEAWLDENDQIQTEWAILRPPNNYKYAAKYDVDNDGIIDTFLTYFNDKPNIVDRYELWLMNGVTNELTLFAAHQDDVWGSFVFKDMNNQAGVELLSSNQGTVIYSLDTAELLYQPTQTHGELIGYCDINGDNVDELIGKRSIVDIVNDKQLSSLESPERIEIFNLGNANQCSLLIRDYGQISLYKYQDDEFISSPITLANSGIDYITGNFDGDNADELIYLYQNRDGNHSVLVNFEDGSTPLEQPLVIPDGMEFVSYNIRTTMDLDGDNIDEILYYNHIPPSKTWHLSAINLSDLTLTTSYTSNNNFKRGEYSSSGGGSNFEDDSFTMYYNHLFDSARIVTFSANTSPTEVEAPIGRFKRSEKTSEGVFYYAHNVFGANNRYEIIKYNEAGVIIWRTEIANDYRNASQDIDIGSGILIMSVAGSNPYQLIMNTDNGNILRESSFSEDASFTGGFSFLSPSISDRTMVINGRIKETLGYSDGILNSLFSGLDSSFGIDFNDIDNYASFIQYDDDPQLEILIYYQSSGEDTTFQQSYLILDSLTWEKEELKRGEQGFVPYQTFIPQREITSCFKLDNTCRNSLNSKNGKIEMIDKLTGSTIWQSPYFPGMSSVKFDIEDDNHIRFAIYRYGIYIFE